MKGSGRDRFRKYTLVETDLRVTGSFTGVLDVRMCVYVFVNPFCIAQGMAHAEVCKKRGWGREFCGHPILLPHGMKLKKNLLRC